MCTKNDLALHFSSMQKQKNYENVFAFFWRYVRTPCKCIQSGIKVTSILWTRIWGECTVKAVDMDEAGLTWIWNTFDDWSMHLIRDQVGNCIVTVRQSLISSLLLGFKCIRGLLVGLSARPLGSVKPLTPLKQKFEQQSPK